MRELYYIEWFHLSSLYCKNEYQHYICFSLKMDNPTFLWRAFWPMVTQNGCYGSHFVWWSTNSFPVSVFYIFLWWAFFKKAISKVFCVVLHAARSYGRRRGKVCECDLICSLSSCNDPWGFFVLLLCLSALSCCWLFCLDCCRCQSLFFCWE